MPKATYNITNDRLKFYPEELGRLPKEEYEKARKCNFLFWHGSKCFSAVWTVQGEDFIRSYGIEIEEDDTPDDVEARVARFQKYAENDERSAASAQERVTNANTIRQARIASNTFSTKIDEAEYWHNRIAGSISHAQHHDRPDVICRRIKGLEADLRKHQRGLSEFIARIGYGWVYDEFQRENKIPWEVKRTELTSEQKEAYAAYIQDRKAKTESFHTRWIDHIEKRLEYERAYLDAVGGDSRAGVADVEKGDIVSFGQNEWEIYSLGKVNLVLFNSQAQEGSYQRFRKVGREKVTFVRKGTGKPIVKPKREDGIKKGVTVSFKWGYAANPQTFTAKVISAGSGYVKVERPEELRIKGFIGENEPVRVLRRDCTVVEV